MCYIRCYQQHIQDFPFVGFLPSVPLLFPPLLAAKRLPQLQGTWGNAVKTPSESKAEFRPTIHSGWVHLIQFSVDCTAASGDSQPQTICGHIIYAILCNFTCVLVQFGGSRLSSIAEEKYIALRSNVACPDF